MTTDRRNPYRPFQPDLIREFLNGRTVREAARFPMGKSNTNYKLRLSDDSVCVLRLYSRGDAKRENYAMELVRNIIPVPHEIGRGSDWSIFTYLPGQTLEQTPEHLEKAAMVLAKLRSVTFEAPGFVNESGIVTPFPFGDARGFLQEQLEQTVVQNWLEPKIVEALKRILKQEQERFEAMNEDRCLVHGDFNPTNILIHENEVSGVLDWEYFHSGSPYLDIGNLLRHADPSQYDSIPAGMKSGGVDLPDDWQHRAQLMDLTSQVEFLSSTRSDRFKRECVARIERYVSSFI